MRKEIIITPKLQNTLTIMGEQIKLARLRRNLSASLVANRAGISRPTLQKVEQGAPDVAIGTYARVLQALSLEEDILLVAKNDLIGRTCQDLGMKVGKRIKR